MGTTQKCYVLFWTNPRSNIPQLYGYLLPITFVDSNTRTLLCWPTSKILHSSALYRHWTCKIIRVVIYYINDSISHHHHHHVVPLAQISLTLSRHFFLSFIASGWSSGLHPVSSHSCCMYARAGHPAFAWPYAGVHTSTSLMSSSLFSSSVLRVWFV